MSASKKTIILIIALFAIALIVVGIILKTKNASSLSGLNSPKAVTINTEGQPTIGNKNAPLHIVAFEDLKCSNCKNYSNVLFPKIKKQYIDTGRAQYSMILLAFINGSASAANAALCLREQSENYFFPYIDYLYKTQPPETENWTTASHLLIAASQATPEANREQLSTCLFENRYTDVIEHNLKQAKKVMQTQVGTPSLYVNGVLVRPLTMDQLDKVIKAAQ